MINCQECGAEHFPGALFCDMCGAAIHPAAQAHLAAAGGPGRFPFVTRGAPAAPAPAVFVTTGVTSDDPGSGVTSRALRVRLPNHQTDFTVSGDLIAVGRADPEAGYVPEIDLTAYGGQARGVSRRHAIIEWIEGGYVIVDQHSSNGTWLNGARLMAGQPYPLPPEANLRFGGLLVQLAMAD